MNAYRALRVHAPGPQAAAVERLPLEPPDDGEVLVRVQWSSVNYKDALAGTGRAPVVRRFPLTLGIDLAGEVADSRHPGFRPGQAVLATGFGLGVDRDGGLAEYARVPGDWLLAVPAGLDASRAMTLGTAGFTAALAVSRLQGNGQRPDQGPVLVTGATGGVGAWSVALLSHLGYEVVALTGKTDQADWLRALGASEVLPREALPEPGRPLTRARWAGAVDSLGGAALARLLSAIQPWGNVAAIGLAAGSDLETTVMPFILRAVSLLGVDSVSCPRPLREDLWQRLARDWRPPRTESLVAGILALEDLPRAFEEVLAGRIWGRLLVRP